MEKKLQTLFCFWDNCIWKCCCNLSLIRREYLLLALNGLRNSPKILHITKKHFFPTEFRSQGLIWKSCCGSHFNSVSARLPCYLSKGPLKQDFLDFYLTTLFGVGKLKNTSVMRGSSFFLKMFKMKSKFRKWKKELPKKIFSEITVSEFVAINCPC